LKNLKGGSNMGKFGKVIRYASCLTVILIVFSILSTAALAGSGAGASNDAKNGKTLETLKKQELVKEKIQARNQTENRTLEREQLREEAQERTQLKEQLKVRKNNYQSSKKNFLAIRKQLRSGNYGDEELGITREYLNSSIDYMIAHLEKVQYNLEQSNGNGTGARIATIEERISQLQDEKKAIGKAEDLEDFANATESVRGVWNNVINRTAVETGQTACESLDKFVNKSEAVSLKLENEIGSLNKTGVDTTELEAKLANYNSLMDSARENNEAAKKIYNKENATQEELQKADHNLQSALNEIKEANQILKEIFGELKQYRIEEANRIRTQNALGTEFTDTEISSEGETNSSSGNESENSSEGGLES
jgi:DNA repair ATPase RecN